MPSFEEIITFQEPDPDEDPWVGESPAPEQLSVLDYDSAWPKTFETIARSLLSALGSAALAIDHVGSTAVPGLAAKNVIDIDLIVADPREEERYVPSLEHIGYALTIREPSFYEHRMFRLSEPRVNLHVFGPDCPENTRHRLFRDWLRDHPEDRFIYEEAKRLALLGGGGVMDYNARKQAVVRDIYDRIFAARAVVEASGTST